MAQMIQQYTSEIEDINGVTYTVLACGEESDSGTWEGWLEFHPADKAMSVLLTDRETTQPNKRALEYWASGLEPIYFEGAFERASTK